jgi:hypothetical protein
MSIVLAYLITVVFVVAQHCSHREVAERSGPLANTAITGPTMAEITSHGDISVNNTAPQLPRYRLSLTLCLEVSFENVSSTYFDCKRSRTHQMWCGSISQSFRRRISAYRSEVV